MFALDHGPNGALTATAGCAMVVYLIFKRWEPWKIPVVASLTVLLPTLLSLQLVGSHGLFEAIAITFSTFYSVLFALILLYRLSPIHPLSQYPGPLQCKISGFWIAWVVSKGKRHLYIQSLHAKYGDAVRTGPNELSINDAAVIQPILGPMGWPKGPGMSGRMLHQDPLSMIALPTNAEHAQRRRPWNRAFSSAAVKEYQPIVARRVSQLATALQEQQGQVDLAQWISYFTYDFMGDMAFGGGTDMLREGDQDGLWKLLKDGMSTAVIFEHVPWVAYYVSRFPSLIKNLADLRTIAFGRGKRRYENGAKTKDLFYYLSNEDHAETEAPSMKAVVSEAVLAIVAGSDTTAVTLANIFYYLLLYPDVYKRLQAEVDKYYPPDEDALDPKHHVQMHYLEAVINETMRLHPALASGSPRTPPQGFGDQVVCNYFVPENTQVRVHPYSIHHDPRNFSNPDLFWPDRWLIADGLQKHHEKIAHNAGAFIPFSIGPRNCVGKNLGQLEMRMVICQLMQKLDIAFADGWDTHHWLDDLEDVFVTRMGQLPVVLRAR